MGTFGLFAMNADKLLLAHNAALLLGAISTAERIQRQLQAEDNYEEAKRIGLCAKE